MFRVGLKLWSTNTDHYLREAVKLYAARVCDYLEIYFVPGSLETVSAWKAAGVPCIVHAPHSAHGVNLASPEAERDNMAVFADVRRFADGLSADVIIAHGGVLGSAEEAARQLKLVGDGRLLVENKPYFPIDGTPRRLAGSTPGEIARIRAESGCGFCFDVGHAVASANAHGADWRDFVEAFLAQAPKMYHLSDIDTASTVDQHLHLGGGNLPIGEILGKIPPDSALSIETVKDSAFDLADFRRDAEWLRRFG